MGMRLSSSQCCVVTFMLITVCLFVTADSQGKGSIERRTYFFEEAKKDMDYALYVPESYDGSEKVPLIVLLHGLGSNPHQIIRYEGVTDEAERRGYIIAAPYGYNERGWYGSRGKGKEGLMFGERGDPENLGELSEQDVLNVMKIVRKEFKVDENRIYLMGHSMGGGGTIYLGGAYPSIWAGIAPMAPAVFFDSSILKKMKKVPVYIVTGELDRLVPVGSVRRWVKEMEELEMDCKYNEIRGGDHANSITNNPEMIALIYDFFDTRKKRSLTRSGVAPFRVFSNKSGKSIKARMDSVTGDKVTIIRDDGRKFTLLIDSLSEEDQEFLKDWSDNSLRD
jgi:poly(3-hydroxybutyrate) depolymerase